MQINEDISCVAVVGCGTIGAGWATLFLAAGLDVVVADPSANVESYLDAFVRAAWPVMASLGLAAGARSDRLRFAPVAEACRVADFIQESAPEREALKLALYADIDGASRPGVIIASSSSAMAVTTMQYACRHPERVVLGHPFNPPHLMPLVEVAGGEATSRDALRLAEAFYAVVGKTPVRLEKEVAGHVANRLQAAVFREAVHLLDEGVASVGDIDRAMTEGPGLRWALMGPFLTYHLAGGDGGMAAFMEKYAPMQSDLWDNLGRPSLDLRLQRAVVDAMAKETFGSTPASLTSLRDERLLSILAARDATKRRS